MDETKASCPSCGEQSLKEGNVITCEKCDAKFTFKKTGNIKAKEIGRLKALEDRVGDIESHLAGQEPDPAALELNPADQEPNPAKHEPKPDDEEPSLLG